MQAKERLPAVGVIHHLFDEPAKYQFRQALRILLLWLRQQGVTYDDAFKHVLRFQNSVSLGFPTSEIEALTAELAETDDLADCTDELGQVACNSATSERGMAPSATPARIALTPAFIGLLGASGSLPFHYSERIAGHQLHTKDESARAFLDLLSNRMVGLFFETWGKYRLEANIDMRGVDPLRGMLNQLGGFKGKGAPRHNAGAEDDVEAYFAAAFRTRPVSATCVADALSDHFGVPVELEQFVGCWDVLNLTQQTVMGRVGAALGHGATLGKRIWRCDLRIRLNIGPLDAAQRDRCLPNGRIAMGMKRMLQRFGMSNLDCEVRLLLKPECIHPAALTANKPAPDRLGWGSFLASAAGLPKKAAVRYLFEMHAARPHAGNTEGYCQ
jgi:type VI secretion system protein ImpH